MRFVVVHGGSPWPFPATERASTPHPLATPHPNSSTNIVYLAAALPREGCTYPEAIAMRDDVDQLSDGFDADFGEMLGYLTFDDDGAMWFADFHGGVEVLLSRLRRGRPPLGVRTISPVAALVPH